MSMLTSERAAAIGTNIDRICEVSANQSMLDSTALAIIEVHARHLKRRFNQIVAEIKVLETYHREAV